LPVPGAVPIADPEVPMRAAVVLNSTAGADVGRDNSPETILDLLRKAGLDPVVVGEPEADLPDRIAAAVASRPDVVIVGGGDGSISCAAQQMMDTDIPLGILPLGTMNILARDLELPLELEAAIGVIAEGHCRLIDVGTLNDHVFLCKSMIGLPANIAQMREHGRGNMNATAWLRLARAFAAGLSRYPLLSMGLRIEGLTRRVRARALAVSCNAYDEGFGRAFKRSSLEGGELVLYIPHGLNLWKLLRLAAGLATGSWQRQEGLESIRLENFTVVSPRPLLRVMLDGEVRLVKPPLDYRIRPRSLKVMAPPPQDDKPEQEAVRA
jgi:diacylglycerol kinase family enzyme